MCRPSLLSLALVLLQSSEAFVLHPKQNSLPSTTVAKMVSTEAPQLPETQPLPPHTFAGMVEQGMIEKFGGEQDIQRILTSWRLLEKDYVHKEYVGPSDVSPDKSSCHQLCHSYVPGLPIQEFWDVNEDPKINKWTVKLQKKYKEIVEEFKQVAIADPDKLQKNGNNIWAGALTEDASSYGLGWKTLVLCDRGVWDPVRPSLLLYMLGFPGMLLFLFLVLTRF